MHVTVVIPTFNRAALLAGAVEAALAQTHPDLDVLVVDDGSTDRTADRLATFARDPRVSWVRLARSGGAAAARNLGLLLSRGEAVCFHACDDLPARGKVAAQLDALDGAAAARADAIVTGHVLMLCDGSEEVAPYPDCADLRPAVSGRRPPIDAGLFRREVFARLGGFVAGTDADRDMRLRIRAAGGIVELVPRPLLTRFQRPDLRVAGKTPARGVVSDPGFARGSPRRPIPLAALGVAAAHSHRPLRIDPRIPVVGFHPSLARFGLVPERHAPAAAEA